MHFTLILGGVLAMFVTFVFGITAASRLPFWDYEGLRKTFLVAVEHNSLAILGLGLFGLFVKGMRYAFLEDPNHLPDRVIELSILLCLGLLVACQRSELALFVEAGVRLLCLAA